ncbi:MAG: hypothetical protein NTV65_01645, partial [Proteobacteria bacterium]|nr:hypothetical protein [Pseudomonadota bacterium]
CSGSMPIRYAVKLITGEPDAGDPPVRFGGRGGANAPSSTPIQWGGAYALAKPWDRHSPEWLGINVQVDDPLHGRSDTGVPRGGAYA